jgi:hypothetical protein
MTSAEIKEMFRSAGVSVPDFLSERIDDEEYDYTESWCCGYLCTLTEDGLLVQAYCKRGRGSDKRQWIINKSGITQLASQHPDWLFGGEYPEEEDYDAEADDNENAWYEYLAEKMIGRE